MRSATLWWASALCSCTVRAFHDTSPFFLFSTSSRFELDIPQIIPASSLSRDIESQLSRCPSDTYVLVSQPGATALDYSNGASTLQMEAKLLRKDATIKTSLTVENVLGDIDIEGFSKLLQQKCDAALTRVDASTGSFAIADEQKPRVMTLSFPPLPSGPERVKQIQENDAFLASILDWLPSPDHTVIYSTTPASAAPHPSTAEPEAYEMDTTFGVPVHMDLKRDLAVHRRASDNVTLPDGPLFARYQYFSNGLFMGLFVASLLSSILYVGITGVASLQVSYSAFDKELGPAAQQKKPQQ